MSPGASLVQKQERVRAQKYDWPSDLRTGLDRVKDMAMAVESMMAKGSSSVGAIDFLDSSIVGLVLHAPRNFCRGLDHWISDHGRLHLCQSSCGGWEVDHVEPR